MTTKNEAMLSLVNMVLAGNTDFHVLEEMATRVMAMPEPSAVRARVLVTVSGGVAEVETFGLVDYELLDFDDLEAEGLNEDQRRARNNEDRHWLKTGEVTA